MSKQFNQRQNAQQLQDDALDAVAGGQLSDELRTRLSAACDKYGVTNEQVAQFIVDNHLVEGIALQIKSPR
jgi:hypothetical protein